MKYYLHIHTNEKVYEDEAVEYVLDKLGLIVEPRGENGEYTQKQIDNIRETIEWYFSGNWVEKEEKEEN